MTEDDTADDAQPRSDPLAHPDRPRSATGRKAPVPKRKKPGAFRVPPRAHRHGLLIVHTGDGKGKTTAALGLLLRATGRGMRVGMYQFVKRLTDAGEHRTARRLGVDIISLGAVDPAIEDSPADDAMRARDGWIVCRTALASGEYDVLVLDELTLPMHWGWIDPQTVIDAIAARTRGTHVIVTGRHAPDALIAAADLVTEMRMIKHPYHERSLLAQAGIDV